MMNYVWNICAEGRVSSYGDSSGSVLMSSSTIYLVGNVP